MNHWIFKQKRMCLCSSSHSIVVHLLMFKVYTPIFYQLYKRDATLTQKPKVCQHSLDAINIVMCDTNSNSSLRYTNNFFEIHTHTPKTK